jgi:hypothetical protein
MKEYEALVEWYWVGKAEVLGGKPVPVALFPPQIPHRMARDRTQASAASSWQLTTWDMVWPITTCNLVYLGLPYWLLSFLLKETSYYFSWALDQFMFVIFIVASWAE